MLTYAIGDIHGCLDQLLDLLEQIGQDADGRPYRLVCLGDYVDRGPDSAGVIATLRAIEAEGSPELVCLKGNHEQLMATALLNGGGDLAWWLDRAGGDATLSSFRRNGAGIPPDVAEWVARRPTFYDDGLRYFVHAGIDPRRTLSAQFDEDRLWIRETFLRGDHDPGRYVVHGHTPNRSGRPEVRRFRANLDTAAVYGGRLTAGIFTDGAAPPVGFLQA